MRDLNFDFYFAAHNYMNDVRGTKQFASASLLADDLQMVAPHLTHYLRDQVVIDIGCGDCRFWVDALKHGVKHVVGTELLKYERPALQHVTVHTLFQGEFPPKLPAEAKVAFCNNVLPHLENPHFVRGTLAVLPPTVRYLVVINDARTMNPKITNRLIDGTTVPLAFERYGFIGIYTMADVRQYFWPTDDQLWPCPSCGYKEITFGNGLPPVFGGSHISGYCDQCDFAVDLGKLPSYHKGRFCRDAWNRRLWLSYNSDQPFPTNKK